MEISNKLQEKIDSIQNINQFEKFLQDKESINEGILGGVVGGLVGLTLGRPLMRKLCEILGISKDSILYNILTSRVVAASVGAVVGGTETKTEPK